MDEGSRGVTPSLPSSMGPHVLQENVLGLGEESGGGHGLFGGLGAVEDDEGDRGILYPTQDKEMGGGVGEEEGEEATKVSNIIGVSLSGMNHVEAII